MAGEAVILSPSSFVDNNSGVVSGPDHKCCPVVIAHINPSVAGNRTGIAVATQALPVVFVAGLAIKARQHSVVHEGVKQPTIIQAATAPAVLVCR